MEVWAVVCSETFLDVQQVWRRDGTVRLPFLDQLLALSQRQRDPRAREQPHRLGRAAGPFWRGAPRLKGIGEVTRATQRSSRRHALEWLGHPTRFVELEAARFHRPAAGDQQPPAGLYQVHVVHGGAPLLTWPTTNI